MRFLKRMIKLIILVTFLLVLFFIYKGQKMYINAVNSKSIDEVVSSIKEKDNYTNLSELPEMYKKAVIAVEDNRFYAHDGVDPIAILRAIINDIRTFSFAEGGSTITQQLAKNTYFTQEKKFERKIAEIFMAYEYEKKLQKDEILELYINTCYFGNGYYSVKDACRRIF